MSPKQYLYDALYAASEKLGYETFQFLPPKQTPYPFVVMSSVQEIKLNLKTALQGKFAIDLHVWGDRESWPLVTEILDQLDRVARQGLTAGGYHFVPRIEEFNSQTIIDDSVENTILNHGILTLSFVLS